MPTPAEIRARLSKITPGEWTVEISDSLHGYWTVRAGGRRVAEVWNDSNGPFIASAPADLAWLLAEHDRLSAIAVAAHAWKDAHDNHAKVPRCERLKIRSCWPSRHPVVGQLEIDSEGSRAPKRASWHDKSSGGAK